MEDKPKSLLSNGKFSSAMQKAWKRWHWDWDEDEIPSRPNPSFERGFEAALNELFPILQQAAIHVLATNGAEHMLDGFNQNPPERPSDELVKKLREYGL